MNGKAPTDIQRDGNSPQVSAYRSYKKQLSSYSPINTENAMNL